jgi:N-acetylmuramoyl-L-alanine amidase
MTETTRPLTPNAYSRPGSILGVIIHWYENAGQDADACWRYIEDHKYGTTGYGGAHDFLGLGGNIIHAIPYSERTHHVGAVVELGEKYNPEAIALFGPWPNYTTIGVEWAHPDWTGKPTDATYKSGIVLYSRICAEFDLAPLERIQTHSFVTGKRTPQGPCHKYFHENPLELRAFQGYVWDAMSGRMP